MNTSKTIENESKKDLFSPIQLGRHTLKNRIIMAPMTRCRADENNIPTEMNRIYYQQRSSTDLIITEGTQISPQGAGYPKIKVQFDQNVVIDDRVITSNGGPVSYQAAFELLAKLSSEKFAKEISEAIQFNRLKSAFVD